MRLLARLTTLTLTLALAMAPLPGAAVPPVVALLAKQMLKDMFTSTLKSALLDSLNSSGCKGTALANAISAAGGGARGLTSALMPGGGMVPVPGTAGMPMGPGDMAAMMARMMPSGAGVALDPAQAEAMTQMIAAMRTPLSAAETLATMDEMAELGLLPKAMHAELKECMVVLPQAAQAMGMGMGMMKTMLPRFREARDAMRALSPSEQDELAAALAEEFDKLPAEERKALLSDLGAGLFPPRVVESLTQRYGGR